jgi:hypothetical protein
MWRAPAPRACLVPSTLAGKRRGVAGQLVDEREWLFGGVTVRCHLRYPLADSRLDHLTRVLIG